MLLSIPVTTLYDRPCHKSEQSPPKHPTSHTPFPSFCVSSREGLGLPARALQRLPTFHTQRCLWRKRPGCSEVDGDPNREKSVGGVED